MADIKISWNGIEDKTGYLFSFTKSLSAAVKNSPYRDLSDDIIATSGFAFRMWVDANQLCPSATSIWSFDSIKPWLESGSLICQHVGRYWGQDDIEEDRRLQALENIRKSIDRGIAAISWDIGLPEWGLITGYDDKEEMLTTLSIKGEQGRMSYEKLGKREIPILSVTTIEGKSQKSQQDILKDTIKIAITHLKGEEWCDNAKGLDAYPALISYFEEKFDSNLSFSMEYYLGTYGSLKKYAQKYFIKTGQTQLAELYEQVYGNWMRAFDIKTREDICTGNARGEIATLLKDAYVYEKQALELMKAMVI